MTLPGMDWWTPQAASRQQHHQQPLSPQNNCTQSLHLQSAANECPARQTVSSANQRIGQQQVLVHEIREGQSEQQQLLLLPQQQRSEQLHQQNAQEQLHQPQQLVRPNQGQQVQLLGVSTLQVQPTGGNNGISETNSCGTPSTGPIDVAHIQLTEINGRWMVPVATTADGVNWDVSFQDIDVSTLGNSIVAISIV